MKYIGYFYKNIAYLLFLFFFSSLIGGLLETFYVYILYNKFYIGGFLFGPMRPIYGLGCLLLYFLTRKNKENYILIFIKCFLILSIFEYFSSLLLEIVFDKTWWNYSNYLFNLDGRICLFISIVWGLLGIVYLNCLEPLLRKLFNKIKKETMVILLHGISFYFLIDLVLSLIININ